MREEGEALPSRPLFSPRVPVAAASESVAVKQSTLVHEIVIINNGTKGLGALKRESHFVTIPHN